MLTMECYERGKKLLERGDLEGSCRALSEFIKAHERLQEGKEEEIRERMADAFNTRGHIKYLWVDFDSAVEDYTEAIQRDPEFAIAYYNRGQIHYRLGRFKLAEKDLIKALELNPDFTDALRNLEQVQRDLKDGHRFNQADKLTQESQFI